MPEKLCEFTNEKKYITRKSPPMSATTCPTGLVEKGNDGNNWQVVKVGNSQRWVLCGRPNTSCDGLSKTTKKSKKKSSIKVTKKSTNTKKVCPPGKVLNPTTGRCVKDKSFDFESHEC